MHPKAERRLFPRGGRLLAGIFACLVSVGSSLAASGSGSSGTQTEVPTGTLNIDPNLVRVSMKSQLSWQIDHPEPAHSVDKAASYECYARLPCEVRPARTSRYAPEQKAAQVEAYAPSGLSGPRFAALRGVNYQTFASWLQKGKRAAAPAGLPAPPDRSLVAVEVPSARANAGGLAVLFPGVAGSDAVPLAPLW
jgi:hypothetical protein